MNPKLVRHPLEPVFDSASRVLILGTMPSPKSRETGFYYNHPQNRFWRVISAVLGKEIPKDNTDKRRFLLEHHIALWDVLASCEITGASDASIQNPSVNDIGGLLTETEIRRIFTTGNKAFELYQKYCFPVTGITAVSLPSTSSANARMGMNELKTAYSVVAEALYDTRTSL